MSTSLIQWFKESRAAEKQRTYEAELEAIFLIRKLDALAVECANNIREYSEIVGQLEDSPDAGSYGGCVKPDFDIDRSKISKIDKHIAAKIVWLENDMTLGREMIRSLWWHDALEWREAHENQANLVGYYGMSALNFAVKLRKHYGLAPQSYMWGMNGVDSELRVRAKRVKKSLSKL